MAQETEEGLIDKARRTERRERFLKNEAYAFIIARGLIEDFRNFSSTFNQNSLEADIYRSVINRAQEEKWIEDSFVGINIGGEWIDI